MGSTKTTLMKWWLFSGLWEKTSLKPFFFCETSSISRDQINHKILNPNLSNPNKSWFSASKNRFNYKYSLVPILLLTQTSILICILILFLFLHSPDILSSFISSNLFKGILNKIALVLNSTFCLSIWNHFLI